MEAEILIENLIKCGYFSDNEISAIHTDKALREGLVNYFRVKHNRLFAPALLETFIKLRKHPDNEISVDDLMLASFLLGMHGQVEDSLKVWEAKRVDFDTYYGVDIQLIPIAGVDKTITFLKNETGEEAKKALEYVLASSNEGDFDKLMQYYEETPWWV